MDTDHLGQSILSGSSKHPPPLKPLPRLPQQDYLMWPKPLSRESLLSHPVPSPSLRFDMMLLSDQQSHSDSSLQSFTFSSISHSDSTSSIIDFVQSLLPPTPSPTEPCTPVNSINGWLQEAPAKPTTSPASSISKRSATPDQLHRLCTELENLKMQRRDSAMFDTTNPERPTIRKVQPDQYCRSISPTLSDPIYPGYIWDVESNAAVSSRSQCPLDATQHKSSEINETSFIDWDDDVPRLAKMKKSFADLRAGPRLHIDSASHPPAKSGLLPSVTTPPLSMDSTNTASRTISKAISVSTRQNVPSLPARTSSKLGKKRSSQHRRTILIADNARRLWQPDNSLGCSSNPTPTSTSVKRKRTSTISSNRSSHSRSGRFNKIARWMKSVIKCS